MKLKLAGPGQLAYYLNDPDGHVRGPIDCLALTDTNPLSRGWENHNSGADQQPIGREFRGRVRAPPPGIGAMTVKGYLAADVERPGQQPGRSTETG